MVYLLPRANLLNSFLFHSYNVISSILDKFGLILEHGKTEVFHFSRLQRVFNPPSLDLLEIGSPVLKPKDIWRYLGFIFNRKLLFHQHINFHANKAISTIKYIKVLGNSTWASFLNRNNFYTEVVSFLLPYIDSNFGFTRKCHYHICLRSSTICNKEPPFGFLKCSRPLHPLGLKLLLDLYLSIFTYASLVVKLN